MKTVIMWVFVWNVIFILKFVKWQKFGILLRKLYMIYNFFPGFCIALTLLTLVNSVNSAKFFVILTLTCNIFLHLLMTS